MTKLLGLFILLSVQVVQASGDGKCPGATFLLGFDFASAKQKLESGEFPPKPVMDTIVAALETVDDPWPDLVAFLRWVLKKDDRFLYTTKVGTQLTLWGQYSRVAVRSALGQYIALHNHLMGNFVYEGTQFSHFCNTNADKCELLSAIKRQLVAMGNQLEEGARNGLVYELLGFYRSEWDSYPDFVRGKLTVSTETAAPGVRLVKRGMLSAELLPAGIRMRMELDDERIRYLEQNPLISARNTCGPKVAARALIAEVLAEWALDPGSPLCAHATKYLFDLGPGLSVSVRTFERMLKNPKGLSRDAISLAERFMKHEAGTESAIRDASADFPE